MAAATLNFMMVLHGDWKQIAFANTRPRQALMKVFGGGMMEQATWETGEEWQTWLILKSVEVLALCF
jgi:hypothetical protein